MSTTEAAADQIAAIAGHFVVGELAQAQAIAKQLAGQPLPQLEQVVAEPRHAELRAKLDQQGVDLAQMQRLIEQLIAKASTPAASEPPSVLQRKLPALFQAAASGRPLDELLAELRAELASEHPDKSPQELDAFIDQFRQRLAAFAPQT